MQLMPERGRENQYKLSWVWKIDYNLLLNILSNYADKMPEWRPVFGKTDLARLTFRTVA